jgi:hypothetical protein
MANSDQSGGGDKVGYGKRPKHTQFQRGKSGNPKGRPKGSRNFASEFRDELKRPVAVTEDGRRRRITKRKAMAKQLINKAVGGDAKFMPMALNEIHNLEKVAGASSTPPVAMAHEDEIVVESIIRRIRETTGTPPLASRSNIELRSELPLTDPQTEPSRHKEEGSQ